MEKTMEQQTRLFAQNLHSSLRITFVLVVITLLSACGGGGGDPQPPIDMPDGLLIGDTMGDETLGDETLGDETLGDDTADVPSDDDLANAFPPVYQTPFGVEVCSVEDINLRVDFDMRDYYIYYNQVPQLNLADYDEPEELIRDLRVDPDTFSFISDAEEREELVENGGTRGFGFSLRFSQDDIIRVKEILFGSPADDQGMLRGDELLLVNGMSPYEQTEDEIAFAFDPDNAPVNLMIRTGDEAPREVTVDHAEYVWRTAGPARLFPADGLPTVGYLPIRSFLETTEAEIDRSLEFLTSEDGIDELVVDLRYNPGGRTHVTRHIASVVGGAAVENQVFLLRTWNDKYSFNDEADFFDTVDMPLNLPRVFVLVTESSSSASEVFINALKPYIDVVVVGGVTSGKPFTSNTREYCGKAINAMRSLRTNALRVSVAGGIQPDCAIEDRWETQADSVFDPLFGGALSLIEFNSCPTSIQASAPTRSANRRDIVYSDPEIVASEE